MDHERIALGTSVVREAGSCIKALFEKGVQTREKDGPLNLVTQADLRAEALITSGILGKFPHDTIMAEEGSSVLGSTGVRWIVDPLDGTTNFAHGLPHFAVSLALEIENEIVAGWVFEPIRGEMFHAQLGQGCTLNGKPISVTKRSCLSDCLTVSGFSYDRRQRVDVLLDRVKRALMVTRGFRRFGSASLDMAYVAAGRFDIYWEDGLQVWDLAGGSIIVTEAGGALCSLDGSPFDLNSGEVIAAHGPIALEFVAALAKP